MGKLNAFYDRWRGPVVFLWPIILVICAAFAFDIITPADRFSSISTELLAVEIKNAQQDTALARQDSVSKAINEKLDLLVDVACDKLTRDQRVVTRRRFACAQ